MQPLPGAFLTVRCVIPSSGCKRMMSWFGTI